MLAYSSVPSRELTHRHRVAYWGVTVLCHGAVALLFRASLVTNGAPIPGNAVPGICLIERAQHSRNGFTLGTLGAVMARDRYLNRANPWTELFRVTRSRALTG
jgi:hypothetical protein